MRALDFELQELVLDELEALAVNPPATNEQFMDVVRDSPDVRHYIFLHVLVDHQRERVVVVGVGHHARSLKS
jgi:plasmid stabilization system protein ParE